jgi:hypothetical protein
VYLVDIHLPSLRFLSLPHIKGIKRSEALDTLSAAGFTDIEVHNSFRITKEVVEREEPMAFPFLLMSGSKPMDSDTTIR